MGHGSTGSMWDIHHKHTPLTALGPRNPSISSSPGGGPVGQWAGRRSPAGPPGAPVFTSVVNPHPFSDLVGPPEGFLINNPLRFPCSIRVSIVTLPLAES